MKGEDRGPLEFECYDGRLVGVCEVSRVVRQERWQSNQPLRASLVGRCGDGVRGKVLNQREEEVLFCESSLGGRRRGRVNTVSYCNLKRKMVQAG